MKEIRLCWIAVKVDQKDEDLIEIGPWCLDNASSRNELEAVMEAGLREWGPGSHWIQERDVPLHKGSAAVNSLIKPELFVTEKKVGVEISLIKGKKKLIAEGRMKDRRLSANL